MSKLHIDLSKQRVSDYTVPFNAKKVVFWKIKSFSTDSQLSSLCYAPCRLTSEDVIEFKLSLFQSSFDSDTFIIVQLHQYACLGKCFSVTYRMFFLDVTRNHRFTQVGNATHESLNGGFYFNGDSIIAPESGLLVNDTLEVCFEVVKVVIKGTDDKLKDFQRQLKIATLKMARDYVSLLNTGKFADVLLVVSKDGAKKEFHAHKNILTARSPVFRAMFEHKNTKEAQESRVVITDIEPEVFELFIQFVYTGIVEQMDKYAQDLLTVADKYQMKCLKTLCSHHLSSQLTTESVSSILLLADLHNAAILKLICVDYIADHAEKVMATEDWKLIKDKPELLVNLFQNHVKKIQK